MAEWVGFSDKKILKVQTEINNYRTDFFKRSSGVQLPNTICVGGLENTSSNRSDTDFFVSMPIKNQDLIILDVLQELISNMNKNFKLGLLFDNCNDNSFTECRDFFSKMPTKYRHLREVYFIKSDGELFEASAENILFKLCSQRFFVSIQSDIYFTDASFIERAELAFSSVPDLFAISGKALVSFKVLTKFKAFLNSLVHSLNFIKKFIRTGRHRMKLGFYVPILGYYGDLSSPPENTMRFNARELNTIYLGEAIIRGPIIWNAEIFRKLGGYNDVAHPLGRDDCEICFRAYLSGYVSGYLPCRAFSIFNQGTTRKKRSTNDQKSLDERVLLAAEIPSQLLKFWNGSINFSEVKQLKQQKNNFKNIYGNSIFLTKKS